MELVWIAGIIAGISCISWLYGQIQEYIERERSRRRDAIAIATLTAYGSNDAEIHRLQKLVDHIIDIIPNRTQNKDVYEMVTTMPAPTLKDQLCPKCGLGFLVRRRGKYGAFLGCTRYPLCDARKPVGWVNNQIKALKKEQYTTQKAQYQKQFMEDFKKAYN